MRGFGSDHITIGVTYLSYTLYMGLSPTLDQMFSQSVTVLTLLGSYMHQHCNTHGFCISHDSHHYL